MFLPILAAAASFSTPSVDVKVAMEINRNLHRSVDRQRKWTAAEIEVFADPKGKVLTCEVRRFLPHEDVADEMCRVLIGSRVVPAKNFQGGKGAGGDAGGMGSMMSMMMMMSMMGGMGRM